MVAPTCWKDAGCERRASARVREQINGAARVQMELNWAGVVLSTWLPIRTRQDRSLKFDLSVFRAVVFRAFKEERRLTGRNGFVSVTAGHRKDDRYGLADVRELLDDARREAQTCQDS